MKTYGVYNDYTDNPELGAGVLVMVGQVCAYDELDALAKVKAYGTMGKFPIVGPLED